MRTIKTFYAKGKLLLTGEYLILDGAHSLACPTARGQSMKVSTVRGSEIKWKSFDPDGKVWFSATISLFDFSCEKTSDPEMGRRLTELLTEAVRLNSDFLSKWNGFKIETHCEFYPDWGLGSSSTLVYCISKWADVDPFELYRRTFGGSGYDIACADAQGPIFYHVENEVAHVSKAAISDDIKKNLYLLYTGRKQDSREGIEHYKRQKSNLKPKVIDEISAITEEMAKTGDLKSANELIDSHETILSEILHLPTVKSRDFPDFWGAVKSLGAWGGDFLLATSDRPPKETGDYFKQKGISVVLPWKELMSE